MKYSLTQGLVQDPVSTCLTLMETYMRNIYSGQELNQSTGRPVREVVFPGPKHPPKLKYFPVKIKFTITILIVRPIHGPKVK